MHSLKCLAAYVIPSLGLSEFRSVRVCRAVSQAEQR